MGHAVWVSIYDCHYKKTEEKQECLEQIMEISKHIKKNHLCPVLRIVQVRLRWNCTEAILGKLKSPPTSSALCCQPSWVDTNCSLGPGLDSPLRFWPTAKTSKTHRKQWWAPFSRLRFTFPSVPDASPHLPTLSIMVRWLSSSKALPYKNMFFLCISTTKM